MDASTKEVYFLREFFHFGGFILGMPMKINKKVKWSYYIITVLLHFFIILGSLITLVNVSKNLLKLQTGVRLVFSLCTLSIYLYFRVYQHQLAISFTKYDQNSSNYIGHEEMKISAKNFKRTLTLHLIIYGGMVAVKMIAKLLPFHRSELESETYDFIYFYSCGSADTPPVMQFCLKGGNITSFIVHEIMELIFFFCQSSIVLVGNFLFEAVIKTAEAKLQVHDDRLAACIEKIKTMDKWNGKDRVEFASIIKYQQNVFSHIRNILLKSNIPITLHVIFLYVTNIFTIVALASQNFKSMYINLNFVIMATYIFFIHYTFCRDFLTIGSMHEHFLNTLLELPWYERNLKFQKCYFMALLLYQKRYPFTLFGLHEVNLTFFLTNLRRLYSVVNVLLLLNRS